MSQPNPITQSAPSKPANRSGNPILKQWKETGVVPEGYYIDHNKRLRKVGNEPPARVDVDSLSDEVLLAAMRHVAVNDPKTDRSQVEKYARQWAEKKPDDFMTHLMELEAEVKKKTAAGEQVAEDEVAERTEGDEELLAEIDGLIKRTLSKVKR